MDEMEETLKQVEEFAECHYQKYKTALRVAAMLKPLVLQYQQLTRRELGE